MPLLYQFSSTQRTLNTLPRLWVCRTNRTPKWLYYSRPYLQSLWDVNHLYLSISKIGPLYREPLPILPSLYRCSPITRSMLFLKPTLFRQPNSYKIFLHPFLQGPPTFRVLCIYSLTTIKVLFLHLLMKTHN